MSIPIIAFFNNRGGVGKTSMVYHLAWMFADRGLQVIAADLDPQSHLTAAFLDEDRLEELLWQPPHAQTVFGALEPIKSGSGDIAPPHIETISDRLGLIPGDMALSTFEEPLSQVWAKCMERDEHALCVTSAFHRILQAAGEKADASVILVDLGDNLSAINRAALVASDYVVVPLAPDLFSIQGLRNLGPALRRWREEWQVRMQRNRVKDVALPAGLIEPLGYVVLRQSIRLDRPSKNYHQSIARLPGVYAENVLKQTPADDLTIDSDPNCLAALRDYWSLIPLAQEAQKPMFHLKPADGALGAYSYAVAESYKDFRKIAERIQSNAQLTT